MIKQKIYTRYEEQSEFSQYSPTNNSELQGPPSQPLNITCDTLEQS